MFKPLNSLVFSCTTPYSELIRLALYFKNISLSALSGSCGARCSVMTTFAVLKRCSEGTKRTEHYPAEISGTLYHFGRNRSRNRISGTSLVRSKLATSRSIRYTGKLRGNVCNGFWPLACQKSTSTLISSVF